MQALVHHSLFFYLCYFCTIMPRQITGKSQKRCLVEDDAVLHRVKVDLDAVILPQLPRNRPQLRHCAGRLTQEGLQLRVHLWNLHSGHHVSAGEVSHSSIEGLSTSLSRSHECVQLR